MQRDQELHVQTSEDRSTGPAGVTEPPSRLAEGIARGALIVASLTILSRILGLVRTLVFSQTVGASCLGTAYVTANQVPNLLYELILGGALTSAMVPILARSAERAGRDPAEKARVGDITSALLTWTIIIVVPLTVAIIVAAGPIASLLNPSNPNAHCVRADMVARHRRHAAGVRAPGPAVRACRSSCTGCCSPTGGSPHRPSARGSPAWCSSPATWPSCR